VLVASSGAAVGSTDLRSSVSPIDNIAGFGRVGNRHSWRKRIEMRGANFVLFASKARSTVAIGKRRCSQANSTNRCPSKKRVATSSLASTNMAVVLGSGIFVVDDFVGQGGTLTNLIGDIRSQGGRGAGRFGDLISQWFSGQLAHIGRPTQRWRFPRRCSRDHLGNFDKSLDGVNTPETQMADNDYAVGLLLETIAESPYAMDTLVVAIEDDPSDGPDHVDAQRSVALFAGPYVRPACRRFHTFHLGECGEDY
jgi:hypothetical protein